MTISGISEADVRRQLAEEASQAADEGEPLLHEVDPSAMLIMLLDTEEQQYVFHF